MRFLQKINKFYLSALIGLIYGITVPVYSQNKKADSLLTLIKKDKPDTSKINHLNALAWILKNYNTDTAALLSQQAFELAEEIIASSKGTTRIATKNGMANALGQLGTFSYFRSDYKKALEYYMQAVQLNEETKNTDSKAKHLANIGLIYQEQGNYSVALDYFLNALKTFEQSGNKSRMSTALCNIGNVYKDQADFPKALSYYFKSLKIAEETGNKQLQANGIGNIGIIYFLKGDFSPALEYFLKALKISEELGDKNKIAVALGNIGSIYKGKREHEKALDYYSRALKIREEMGAKNLVAATLGNIGSVYASIAENQKSQQAKGEYYKKSFTSLSTGLALDNEIGAMNSLKEDYQLMFSLYERSTVPLPDTIGGRLLNMQQMRLRALYYYKKFISIRDTLFSDENKKQLVQKEMNFEFEKKEAAAKAAQMKNEEIAKAESRKQRIIIVSVVCCLLLVIGLAGFIFRALRITRKQKILIEHQKNLVDEKQKEILDSIYYARRIQRALITSEKYIERNLKRLKI
ncbi:MAG: tetratricopeptide repeat protein [Bacteroidia bacterium]|nr:tetratricopeptide repeat protein [Bacteroidia bacterium]